MTQKPVVCFFLYDKDHPVHSGKEEWTEPLPLGRQDINSPKSLSSISYGDYFKAVGACLEEDGYDMVLYAIFLLAKEKTDVEHLEEIQITIVKHGEYYHPSRIDVIYQEQSFCFVMNVAVSAAGIRAIKKEFGLLDELSENVQNGSLPVVYGFGEFILGKDCPVSMFIAQWFDGYHEFHVTHDPDTGPRICVWDTNQGHVLLAGDMAYSLYMKIAEILTIYYDITTCRQIFPWHHAAGDFIVKISDGDVDVRLITVRQYASMVDIREEDSEVYLAAMLIFFLNLTIRMRLDRVDGVAEMAWLDDFVLDAAFQGFLNGLAWHEEQGTGPEDLTVAFKAFVKEAGLELVTDMMRDVVGSYDAKASEVPLIHNGLQHHMEKMALVLIENGFL